MPRVSNIPSEDVSKSPESAFQDRETISHWGINKEEKNELLAYQEKNNARSLDGLAGLRTARRGRGERMWAGDLAAQARRLLAPKDSVLLGVLLGVVIVLVTQFAWGVWNGYGIRVNLGNIQHST